MISVDVERESADQVERDVKIRMLAKVDDLNDNMEKVKKNITLNIDDFSNKLMAKSSKNSYALDEQKLSLASLEKRLDKKIDDKYFNLERKLDRVVRGLESNQRNQQLDVEAFKSEGNNLIAQISDISDKVLEFEENKRNNLIFYGIPNDIHETHSTLNQKIVEIFKINLQMRTEIIFKKVLW